MFVSVVGDVGGLHSHVGDVDGAREEEEDGQAGQQQAQSDRYRDVQLSAGDGKQNLKAADGFKVRLAAARSSCFIARTVQRSKSSRRRLTSCLV